MLIALCGGIGSGKSAAAYRLRELGYTVIDADAVNRALLQDKDYLFKLKKAFPDCFDGAGSLDKEKLKNRIFTDENSKNTLDSIAHPAIGERIQKEAAAAGTVFVEVPLLKNNKLEGALRFDRIWAVVAPRELRIARICARDGVSPAFAERMIDAQKEEDSVADFADAVIDNGGGIEDLYRQVDILVGGLPHDGE